MCGINGILFFDDAQKQQPKAFFRRCIKKMNNVIEHRGPDGEGIYINYPICLGHRRLSIIDLSDNAAQPMFNEDNSIVLVFNGEIYNYLELIAGLESKGHVFKSKSDSEVILHAFEEYGVDCVNRFNGMWAFVLYDFRRNILFASRDRFGVKPFYYYIDEKCFIFSSEIKAILTVKKIDKANLGKVYDYLAYSYKTNDGETFFKDIHELKSAHSIIIENGNFRCFRYWRLDTNPGITAKEVNEKELYQRFVDLLSDAITLRFRSDVPVALLLSGGLDSTSIARIVDDLLIAKKLDYDKVLAYSAFFPGFEFDESAKIKRFVETCRCITLQEVYPDIKGLLTDLDRFVYAMGEPVLSTTSFAHNCLMREICQRGVKVVLNGQGADEAFAGYGRYIIGYYLLDILFTQPTCFLKEMSLVSQNTHFSRRFLFAQILKASISRRNASYLRARFQDKVIDCLNKDFVRENFSHFSSKGIGRFSGHSLADYLEFNISYQGFNQNLHYEDHSAMQHSIEIRSPFIDYRIMEFAFALPMRYKIENGVTKKIIRNSVGKRLPATIACDPRKIGFATPFNNWMKNAEFISFANNLFDSGFFASKKLWSASKIRERFRSRDKFPNFPFWRVINLEIWSRVYNIENL